MLQQAEQYIVAVVRAGGAPILLPPVADPETVGALAGTFDGLLLSGGDDPDPALWGEAPHPACGPVDPDRDATEMALVEASVARGIPIFGICRGIQLLNVALGGAVVQDIAASLPGAWQHQQRGPRWHTGHSVEIERDSRLGGLLGGGELRVNSFHHQSVGRVAPRLKVTARAGDGVVEGLELPGEPWVVGVQWHPEWLIDRHPPFMALFDAFVREAGAAAGGRSSGTAAVGGALRAAGGAR